MRQHFLFLLLTLTLITACGDKENTKAIPSLKGSETSTSSHNNPSVEKVVHYECHSETSCNQNILLAFNKSDGSQTCSALLTSDKNVLLHPACNFANITKACNDLLFKAISGETFRCLSAKESYNYSSGHKLISIILDKQADYKTIVSAEVQNYYIDENNFQLQETCKREKYSFNLPGAFDNDSEVLLFSKCMKQGFTFQNGKLSGFGIPKNKMLEVLNVNCLSSNCNSNYTFKDSIYHYLKNSKIRNHKKAYFFINNVINHPKYEYIPEINISKDSISLDINIQCIKTYNVINKSKRILQINTTIDGVYTISEKYEFKYYRYQPITGIKLNSFQKISFLPRADYGDFYFYKVPNINFVSDIIGNELEPPFNYVEGSSIVFCD